MLYSFKDANYKGRIIRYIGPEQAIINRVQALIELIQEDEKVIAVMDYNGTVFHRFRTAEEASLWEEFERTGLPTGLWTRANCEL